MVQFIIGKSIYIRPLDHRFNIQIFTWMIECEAATEKYICWLNNSHASSDNVLRRHIIYHFLVEFKVSQAKTNQPALLFRLWAETFGEIMGVRDRGVSTLVCTFYYSANLEVELAPQRLEQRVRVGSISVLHQYFAKPKEITRKLKLHARAPTGSSYLPEKKSSDKYEYKIRPGYKM